MTPFANRTIMIFAPVDRPATDASTVPMPDGPPTGMSVCCPPRSTCISMFRIIRRSLYLSTTIFSGLALSHAQAHISFLVLGPNNSARDVSYAGTVVVGRGLNDAFRSTQATGAVPLATLPNFLG